jgi:hypothetical protein
MDGRGGGEGTGAEVRHSDVLALWFARRLSWIVCLMMFPVGLAVATGGVASGPVDDYGARHPGALEAAGLAILIGMGTLIWAARGLTRGRRGSWTTMVVLLAAWSVTVSFALTDMALRPGAFITFALTVPALVLLMRRGTRRAYRSGAAREMPGF